jgi:hypothetical protein
MSRYVADGDLPSVDPAALASMLINLGWTDLARHPGAVRVLLSPDLLADAQIPLDPARTDYFTRLNEALSAAEDALGEQAQEFMLHLLEKTTGRQPSTEGTREHAVLIRLTTHAGCSPVEARDLVTRVVTAPGALDEMNPRVTCVTQDQRQEAAASAGHASRDPGDLAASALAATGIGDHLGAARAIRELADAGELARAMYRWVDTLVEENRRHRVPMPGAPPRGTVPAGRQPTAAARQDQDAGRWAEQFIAGRGALSHDTCSRLIARVPDSQAERYARRLVEAVSGRIAMLPVTDREPWE